MTIQHKQLHINDNEKRTTKDDNTLIDGKIEVNINFTHPLMTITWLRETIQTDKLNEHTDAHIDIGITG